jgi:hypothetical protein
MSEALASQPIDQLAEPNAVLAWLQIPSDHSELPDVLPERTGVFLRELYEVQPDDPITTEELLGRVAVDIDEINGAVARLNVRFVVAGFNRTTLRLVAPNANRSVNTLRQIVSRRLAAAANAKQLSDLCASKGYDRPRELLSRSSARSAGHPSEKRTSVSSKASFERSSYHPSGNSCSKRLKDSKQASK